jgi:hypothetical protein
MAAKPQRIACLEVSVQDGALHSSYLFVFIHILGEGTCLRCYAVGVAQKPPFAFLSRFGKQQRGRDKEFANKASFLTFLQIVGGVWDCRSQQNML